MCPGTFFGSFQWSVVSCSLETYWTRSGARQMPAVDVTHLYIHLQTLSTDYQHLIFHELCPAAARVSCFQTLQWWAQCWVLFRAGSVSPFPSCSCILPRAGMGHPQEPRQYKEWAFPLLAISDGNMDYWYFTISCLSSSGLFFILSKPLTLVSLWFLGLLCGASQGRKG